MSIQDQQYIDIMLEHLPIGVALFDAQDLRLLAANALYNIFLDTFLEPQWRNGQAFGHPFPEWLPGAEATGMISIFRTVAEKGIPYRAGEYVFPAFKSGITYWNWTLDPVQDTDGRIVQLLQTATEVTTQVIARQQAEQAHTLLSQTNREVEEERKRLEVIETVACSVRDSLDMESISLAVINAVSANFNTISVYIHIANPVQKTLDVVHIHPLPPMEEALRIVQHIPYDSSFPIAQAYKRRDPLIIEDLQTTPASDILDRSNPLVRSGAHGYVCVPLWFKDYFEGTLTALFKENIHADGPEVQALVGSSTHIAAAFAHARLHTAVENERRRLRTVLDQSPEGVLIIEASDGFVSYANTAAEHILGIATTRLVGMPLNQLQRLQIVTNIDGRPMLPWNFPIIRALSGEIISSQEAMVIRPDGSKVVILSSSAPLYSEIGLMTGAVIVFQDITLQKSIEQQKNEFLSIASHELRTPITAIQGFAEILQMQATREHRLSPQSMRALTFISEQSQCLIHLIEEMLDITRIENARLVLNLDSHDLVHTISHVIETQASSIRQHDLQLVLEGLSATDKLVGIFDENRIVQVLSNLISNAVKYSPIGSKIEVGLRYVATSPHLALLWVKDAGIGIAAHEISYIFKRFHRSSGIDRSISGLGIGLYLVQELVTRHGGRVWVESSVGKGSTFFVQLPLTR